MRLMIAQTAPQRAQIPHNLDELEALCLQAKEAQVDLLALPELALTGYLIFDRLDALAESLDGPLLTEAARLARRYGLHLVLGVAEKAADGIYNSAVLLDDQGTLLGCYRKMQLWADEHGVFTPGETPLVVDTRLGRIGLMICYDNEFPEVSRALAQQGAELIISPTANMEPNAKRQQLQITCRALDNQVFVACINRSGQEDHLQFCGHSLVADPDGEVLVQLVDQPDSAILDLDLSRCQESRKAQDYLRDLHPRFKLGRSPIDQAET
ncbi:carbon-nitrogen hydrolase family protein [Pseudomonas sp. CC6-YY-74]|uniref:carbon-nitrogen hydrolase family protein n=1 Tax=Pseudomonas sp. CC6-YY-74 TaxID=1930532 RepID=UPI0009A14D31|nr:carbon-nitrogen hydrolase family protein [Pseudomonas sp. CC6-YY-74]